MTAGTPTDAVSELGDAILGLGRLAQGLPTRDDLRELPHGELLRLSELLDEFAEVTQSWPEVYPCEPVVVAAGDDWADSQYWNLLGGIRTGNRQDATERVTEMDENGEEQVFYRVKTNRQMGLAFSAWTADCHEVASTIEFWAKEKGGDGTALMVRDMMTPDERGELERRRKKAWDWLGAYAFMMVC